jgi:hypothetical protein
MSPSIPTLTALKRGDAPPLRCKFYRRDAVSSTWLYMTRRDREAGQTTARIVADSENRAV